MFPGTEDDHLLLFVDKGPAPIPISAGSALKLNEFLPVHMHPFFKMRNC
jgi:hypothetical protein